MNTITITITIIISFKEYPKVNRELRECSQRPRDIEIATVLPNTRASQASEDGLPIKNTGDRVYGRTAVRGCRRGRVHRVRRDEWCGQYHDESVVVAVALDFTGPVVYVASALAHDNDAPQSQIDGNDIGSRFSARKRDRNFQRIV